MATNDAFAIDILDLVLRATAITGIADNAASAPETNHNAALSTGLTDTGTMSTSEAAYTSYARVVVARSTGMDAAAGTPASSSPAAAITFPAGTGGGETVTHWSLGNPDGGAVIAYFSGTVTPNIATGDGVTPELTTATTITLA